MQVTVASYRITDRFAGANRYAGALLEFGEIRRWALQHRIGDHFAGAGADALELGQRLAVGAFDQLVVGQRIDGPQRADEGADLGGRRQLTIEVVDGL